VPNATLAWWDWRVERRIPQAFARKTAGGKKNPLFSVRINDRALKEGLSDPNPNTQVLAHVPDTTRQPDLPDAPPLPSLADIAAVLKIGQFRDFQDQLEGFHNDVHVWVGGHMSNIPYSAYDPIFWAHHTMIDRIWRLWQLKHPQAGLPPAFLASPLPPFKQTVAETLDVTTLGYDYAVSTAHVPV
jgi:tyrosinase